MDFVITAPARRLTRLQSASILRRRWICPSCRHHDVRPRSFATAVAPPKPYYVTTPIFYVNASPHVGHMYTMVLADVLKRWQVLLGREALLCTGTDEHGMKVQRAAAAADVPPKQLCDTNSATFRELAQKSELSNDFFIRTTDQDHVDAVKHFWFLMKEKGYIYESKHEGWYCVSDETFYPESMLEKKIDPMTGRVHMASIESGHPVEWTEEKNYHFRMTALRDKLLQFYEENPEFVVPAKRMNEVVDWVKNNLEDLSISRPVSRLEWGIRVPDDPSQTIYVWFDALINYLTKAGFPSWTPGKEQEGGWPVDVQVVGKDIVRFHSIYWPAMLMAVDLPPPKRILSHAHFTMGRRKMSKSIGNVVNPFFAIDRWGVDTMRFYLIHDGGIADDSDYGNANIVERYKKTLQWGLGNLTGRITRPKAWNVRAIVESAQDKDLSEKFEGSMGTNCEKQQQLLERLPGAVSKAMETLNPGTGLREIVNAINATNKFVADTEPWALAKKEEPEYRAQLERVVFLASESLRVIGILLLPFIPGKAAELLDTLGVSEEKRTFEFVKLAADFDYGTPFVPVGRGALESLFPPLPVED